MTRRRRTAAPVGSSLRSRGLVGVVAVFTFAVGGALAALPTVANAAVALPALGALPAHNYLVASTPEADSTLTERPESFEIRTNDVLLDVAGDGSGFAFLVRDSNDLYYGDGCVRIVGTSMFTDVALGAPGEYTVLWQVVSADGHPVSDEFTFTWAPASADVADAGSQTAPTCGGSTASGEPSDGETTPPSATPPSAGLPGLNEDTVWIGSAIALTVGVSIAVILSVRRRR